MDYKDLKDMVQEDRRLAMQPPKEQKMFRLKVMLPCQTFKAKPKVYNKQYDENSMLSYQRMKQLRVLSENPVPPPSGCVVKPTILNKMFLGRFGLERTFVVKCQVCGTSYKVPFHVRRSRETGEWRPVTHQATMIRI